MAILTYNNFDLLLHQSLEGYGARELASPVGDTRTLGVAQEETRCP